MKKTLVAIAALAAFGAQAQSSVVLDGYFDRAFTSVNNTNDNKDAKSVGSNAGTTTVGIKVREELGGGMSVGGSINTDWADLGGNAQSNTAGTAQRGGFANSQNFLDLTSAQYGTFRFGTPNSFTLTNATAVAQPAYSTAIGSAYSSNFSIANGVGTGTTDKGGIADVSVNVKNAAGTYVNGATAGQRSIRIANTVQYSSPVVLGGLTAHMGYTPKNNNDTVGSSGAYGNTAGVTEYALRYTNGPVDAMYTSIKYSIGANTFNFGGTATSLTANSTQTVASFATAGGVTSTQNLLGATYAVLPALKLHAGLGKFSSSNGASAGSSTQYGATYTMGQFDIMGQMAKVDDTSTNNYDRKMTGLGVNYNLSKTARVYFRYDSINYASNQASFLGSEQKRSAIGMSKAF